MQVLFNAPKDIITVPEQKVTTQVINIDLVIDFSASKKVQAQTKEIGIITLWEGAAYDAIGQWTDTDVINRVTELYGS
jgi:hypothetical protein